MKKSCQTVLFAMFFIVLFASNSVAADSTLQANLSPETEECIGCHISITPGIVKDWMGSRHYRTTPSDALKLPVAQRRISVEKVPDKLAEVAVGCFECHSRNPDKHADNFEHMGYRINVVVSPNDCSTCHPVEANQYAGTKKAMAYRNLMDNSLYRV
ncbi:hydroxylamine oxidase, partial [bacterium]